VYNDGISPWTNGECPEEEREARLQVDGIRVRKAQSCEDVEAAVVKKFVGLPGVVQVKPNHQH